MNVKDVYIQRWLLLSVAERSASEVWILLSIRVVILLQKAGFVIGVLGLVVMNEIIDEVGMMKLLRPSLGPKIEYNKTKVEPGPPNETPSSRPLSPVCLIPVVPSQFAALEFRFPVSRTDAPGSQRLQILQFQNTKPRNHKELGWERTEVTRCHPIAIHSALAVPVEAHEEPKQTPPPAERPCLSKNPR